MLPRGVIYYGRGKHCTHLGNSSPFCLAQKTNKCYTVGVNTVKMFQPKGTMKTVVFSKEEFNIMTDELLRQTPARFDMLWHIAETSLSHSVAKWCRNDETLCGRGFEVDVMHEIFMRLVKTTVPYFLLRDGADAPVNNDPKGFHSWMYKVALNTKRDFANRVRNDDLNNDYFDDISVIDWMPDTENADPSLDKLCNSVKIVLNLDGAVYKSLTWLIFFVLMLQRGVTKIQSVEALEKEMGPRSLNDMFSLFRRSVDKIPWLKLDDLQTAKIQAALDKPYKDGISFGDAAYSSFFMKKGGKKSISDWLNRINGIIRRSLEDEAS